MGLIEQSKTTFVLAAIIFGFLGGVALASVREVNTLIPLFLVFAGALFFIFLLARRRFFTLLLSLVLLFAAAGLYRFELAERFLHTDVIEPLVGEKILVRGIIDGEIDERENILQFPLEVSIIGVGEEIVPVKTHFLIVVPRYPKYAYGDEIIVEGKLEKPGIIESETGRRFDYGAYLKKDGIVGRVAFPSITVLEKNKGAFIPSALFRFKETFLERVREVVREPESSLLAGLLVGAKQSLGKDLLDAFRRTGLIHIVVLSGYNLTLIADGMRVFLRLFFKGRTPLYAGAVGIILFAVMVGGSATVVRATVMALLGLLAKATGRTQDVGRLLFLAGFGMVLYNPHILLFDPSFQLSFLATAGLIYLSPFFERWLSFMPKFAGFRELSAATFATQVFVLPLLLFQMGSISIVSLPANMLVLPTVSVAMFFGALTGAAAFVHTLLAWPFALATELILSYQLFITKIISTLPFATVETDSFSIFWLLVSYIGLIAWITFLYRRKPLLKFA